MTSIIETLLMKVTKSLIFFYTLTVKMFQVETFNILLMFITDRWYVMT